MHARDLYKEKREKKKNFQPQRNAFDSIFFCLENQNSGIVPRSSSFGVRAHSAFELDSRESKLVKKKVHFTLISTKSLVRV